MRSISYQIDYKDVALFVPGQLWMFVKFATGTRGNLVVQIISRIVTICGKCQTSLCHLVVPFKSCLFSLQ